MAKSKRGPAIVPAETIRAGTKLPPDVAAFVTLAVILRREGDDASGQYAQMSASVMLQADGDEHLLQRIEYAEATGQLQPAIRAFAEALTAVLGGEVVGRTPPPTVSRRVGRA